MASTGGDDSVLLELAVSKVKSMRVSRVTPCVSCIRPSWSRSFRLNDKRRDSEGLDTASGVYEDYSWWRKYQI